MRMHQDSFLRNNDAKGFAICLTHRVFIIRMDTITIVRIVEVAAAAVRLTKGGPKVVMLFGFFGRELLMMMTVICCFCVHIQLAKTTVLDLALILFFGPFALSLLASIFIAVLAARSSSLVWIVIVTIRGSRGCLFGLLCGPSSVWNHATSGIHDGLKGALACFQGLFDAPLVFPLVFPRLFVFASTATALQRDSGKFGPTALGRWILGRSHGRNLGGRLGGWRFGRHSGGGACGGCSGGCSGGSNRNWNNWNRWRDDHNIIRIG
mmetsp:Transcript_35227/g.85377  ORF Transcript_35227/g.85377 Transcript_35227/m.85377 type:complete len:265 (-) Transcript_35227:1438-2232(-)